MNGLPEYAAACFRLLEVENRALTVATRQLSGAQWRELLSFADRTQLTLQLRGAGLPPWFEKEIASRMRKNAERRRRLRAAFLEISEALAADGTEFVLLKGFTHEAGFGIDGVARVQYDIDLLCPNPAAAHRVLPKLGYVPHGESALSNEHGRPFVRPSNWRWRDDYYDPDMPIAVEVHASPWSSQRDRIVPGGMDRFWERRVEMEVDGLSMPAFAEPDRLAFAAVHVLRHILRNDARPAHVYELARFLETRSSDPSFWAQWQAMYDPDLKTIQTIAFRFAREWFGCALPEAVREEMVRLPAPIQSWFRDFAWSPVANLLGPNKDVVWLHLALLPRWRDRLEVLRERLAPFRLPHHEEAGTYRLRLLGRARYHAAALVPALASGVRWWWRRTASSSAAHNSDWKRSSV